MSRLVFSLKSVGDLEGVLRYIARDKPEAAVRFVESIERQCALFVDFPDLGMARDDLAPGLRLFSFRRYGIYYRQVGDDIRIERVLHGALDIAKIRFD